MSEGTPKNEIPPQGQSEAVDVAGLHRELESLRKYTAKMDEHFLKPGGNFQTRYAVSKQRFEAGEEPEWKPGEPTGFYEPMTTDFQVAQQVIEENNARIAEIETQLAS
ncbi:MAG: hypothetical protein Q7S86_01655 [bacterium]|nr:hypothetical protein [bacterium]